HDRRRARVAVAAGLREVAAAGDAEARGERLQQDRHQVREHDHAEERVTVLGAARKVSRPIARVHVADGDEIAGTGEREQLPPEAGVRRDRNRTVNFRQAYAAGWEPPATRGR